VQRQGRQRARRQGCSGQGRRRRLRGLRAARPSFNKPPREGRHAHIAQALGRYGRPSSCSGKGGSTPPGGTRRTVDGVARVRASWWGSSVLIHCRCRRSRCRAQRFPAH
jgi:hypothetical protein